jgi:hypothetical protein
MLRRIARGHGSLRLASRREDGRLSVRHRARRHRLGRARLAATLAIVSACAGVAGAHAAAAERAAAPISKLGAIVAQLERLCLDGQPANLNISSCTVSHIRISTVNSRYASFTAEPRSLTFPGLARERFIAETLKDRWSLSWELGRPHRALEVVAGPFGPSAGNTFTCPPARVLAAWAVSSAGCPTRQG